MAGAAESRAADTSEDQLYGPGPYPQELEGIQRALIEAELPAKVVYSHNTYLDIIPERAGIGSAVKFLVDSLLLFPNQVFVCGQSGNDISLYQYGFRGIVVASAARD